MHHTKSTVPRPSRKVVDPPGGKATFRLYGQDYEESDALSLAPPRDGGSGVDVTVERMEKMRVHVEAERDGGAKVEDLGDKERVSNPPEGFRPSRKVRTSRYRNRGGADR
jgi:hypothetical protein